MVGKARWFDQDTNVYCIHIATTNTVVGKRSVGLIGTTSKVVSAPIKKT